MDAGFYANAVTVPIDSAANPIPVRAAKAGKKTVCTDLFLQAEADAELIVKSGSTALTGTINFKSDSTRERLWQSQFDRPLFKCGTNEAFQITNASTAQVNGWAVIIEVEV